MSSASQNSWHSLLLRLSKAEVSNSDGFFILSDANNPTHLFTIVKGNLVALKSLLEFVCSMIHLIIQSKWVGTHSFFVKIAFKFTKSWQVFVESAPGGLKKHLLPAKRKHLFKPKKESILSEIFYCLATMHWKQKKAK